MSDFGTKLETATNHALKVLRRWDKEAAAEEIMREYLSEEGMLVKSGSKLEELLDERHKLAMLASDETVKLKAIDSAIAMASGSKKVTAVQNNQFNFGKFLEEIKD